MKPADSSCPYGLACRVTSIANGLIRHDRITFRWIENLHCPAPMESVFPNGVPGVDFQKTTEPFETVFFGYHANCWWSAGGDTQRANTAYATVMDAMAGSPARNAPSVAILGRFHLNPTATPEPIAHLASSIASECGENRVFILSDKFRFELALSLSHAGITPVLPHCPPLPVDLARRPQEIVDYMSDWKTLLAAKTIVAINGPASALNPARASDIPIHFHDPTVKHASPQ